MNKKAYENNLIQEIVSSIMRHHGEKCLSSIILTGSFGRSEPTFVVDEEGKWQLKSDVEIALVYPDISYKHLVKKLITAVTEEFEEELNLMPINEERIKKVYNFNYSLGVPKYKTIFMFDLFNGSKTIWGIDFIKSQSVGINELDLYEAKRLVANRIGELIYLQNHAQPQEKGYLKKQWKGKVILAIASAWLICEGKYRSSYHAQHEAIQNNGIDVEKQLGLDFINEYDKVFFFLREDGPEYEVTDELMIEFIQKIDSYFRKYSLDKPKVNSLSRVIKYTIKYIKAGGGFGMIGFENHILQELISGYWMQKPTIDKTADTWHKVLY